MSDKAIREIMGEVERISQEFCCGIDNETVNKYCELVPGQNRFDICKGSCRVKKCAMGVPRIASTARELGWVNTRNGKGWRCSHCTKANEYANTTEEQLKNEISAQEKHNSPVPSQLELVEAIERRKQIFWKQGTSQDERRDLLLKDEEFVQCSSILF